MIQLFLVFIQFHNKQYLKFTIKLILFIVSSMIDQRLPLENLFTFGYGQLQQCLSQERKNKFPFLQNAKIKKTPLLKKLISQQRPKPTFDNQNLDLNLPMSLKSRGKVISFDSRKYAISVDKQTNNTQSHKNSPVKTKEKRKVSLPKVLKNVFPGQEGNAIFQKKIVTIHPSMRYLGEQQSIQLIKPFNAPQTDRNQQSIRQNRAKSVMLLSQNCGMLPEERIKTIQHHRNRLYSKAYKSKTEHKAKIDNTNEKIMENINELKKIYC